MNTEKSCVFCGILEGNIPSFKVYEDNMTLAFMDINPANPGHVLVIPKYHAPDIFELPEDMLSASIQTAQKIAQAIKAAIPSDGLNILQANGKGAAQSVFHFHIHVIPRVLGDDLKLNWNPVPGDMKQISEIAEKLKRSLSCSG